MFVKLFYLLTLLKLILSDDNVYLKKEDLSKLPLATLTNMLKLKGLVCKKCVEKDDFVNEVYKSQSLPIVDPPMNDNPPLNNKKKQKDPKKQKEMDDLFESLKSNGLGNSKMFSADDLKDLTPEQLNDKLSNGKKSKKDKKKKKKDKTNTSSKDNKDKKKSKKDLKKEKKTAKIVTEDETIEL